MKCYSDQQPHHEGLLCHDEGLYCILLRWQQSVNTVNKSGILTAFRNPKGKAENRLEDGELAQWVKAPATKPDNPCPIPVALMVEGKNIYKVVL